MKPTLIHSRNGNVISGYLAILSRINSKPQTKNPGLFLTILKDLKTYFSQFF